MSAFCWQQTGIKRLSPASPAPSATGDPTLNIDPTRDGVEPDFAFTGKADTVPWVVWYEQNASGIGLRGNEQVFAAKAVAGGGRRRLPLRRGRPRHRRADERARHERRRPRLRPVRRVPGARRTRCSLNAVPGHDAEDPRVAAGTLTPGGTTVPWVTWSEDIGSGIHGDLRRAARGRRPLRARQRRPPGLGQRQRLCSPTSRSPATRRTCRGRRRAAARTFVGHLAGAGFVLDTPGGIPAPSPTCAPRSRRTASRRRSTPTVTRARAASRRRPSSCTSRPARRSA